MRYFFRDVRWWIRGLPWVELGIVLAAIAILAAVGTGVYLSYHTECVEWSTDLDGRECVEAKRKRFFVPTENGIKTVWRRKCVQYRSCRSCTRYEYLPAGRVGELPLRPARACK